MEAWVMLAAPPSAPPTDSKARPPRRTGH